MVKFYTSFTEEVDDPETAVQEILEQLNLKENMLKNTIGIVHFYHEFANENAWEAIAQALPFPLAGCVSSYLGSCGKNSEIALSVTMLTSDDVYFSVKTIEGIAAKSREELSVEITQLCAEFCEKEPPKLILPFLTSLPNFSGDDLMETVNALPKKIPFFGTMAINMDNFAGPHFVVGGKKMSPEMYSFVAVYGNVQPKFHVTSSFVFDEFPGEASKITDADKSMLKMVDGISAVEYLKKQGLLTSDNQVSSRNAGFWAVAAILLYPDDTRVVRAFLGIVEGTEYISATGHMKNGAKIMFAHLDGEKTLKSAEQLIEDLARNSKNDFLAYSCIARAWSLGTNFSAEAKKIADFSKGLKYNVAYSGGEICPVFDKNGNMINTLHNFTFIACTF